MCILIYHKFLFLIAILKLDYNVIIKKSDEGNMVAEKLLRAEPDAELKRIAELSIEELDKEVSLEMDNT